MSQLLEAKAHQIKYMWYLYAPNIAISCDMIYQIQSVLLTCMHNKTCELFISSISSISDVSLIVHVSSPILRWTFLFWNVIVGLIYYLPHYHKHWHNFQDLWLITLWIVEFPRVCILTSGSYLCALMSSTAYFSSINKTQP